MTPHIKRAHGGFAPALFVLMLGCVLALAAFGAGIYRSVGAAHAAGNARRATLSYLSARLCAADETGTVRITAGPEGDALALAEPEAGYQTLIYLYQGALVEQYLPLGATLDPAAAQHIADTDRFSVQAEGNLITVTTAQGSAAVALHSRGAVA